MDELSAQDIDAINRALDGGRRNGRQPGERTVWIRKRQHVKTPSIKYVILRDIAARAIESGALRPAEPPEYPDDASWWPADQ